MSEQVEELNWDDVLGGVKEYEDDPETKKSGDFEALPKGPYPVVVQEAVKQIASTGKDMIKARVQVTEGPYANRVLFNYFVFGAKDDAVLNKITLNNLAAFGVTREYIATQRPSIAEIAEALIGLKAIATVGIQDKGEYKGRNEVKGFKPIDGAAPTVPTVAASKPAGVPNIPTPEVAAPAPTPVVPVPQVPVAEGVAEAPDPFEG